MPLALAQANGVEAIVHPVNQEHIRMAGRPEERSGALRQADTSVARAVRRPAIRLGFHDPPDA